MNFYLSSSSRQYDEIKLRGLIKLDTVCILDAHFRSGHYDGFHVNDSSPLKAAISKVDPKVALLMNSDLHMTVQYPSRRKVPGLSEAAAVTFSRYNDFPTVKLHVAEIHVSSDGKFASAIVHAIDTVIMFDFNNNGTPAHLTLWGYPPVMAGHQLIGLSLELRIPFIQITEDCVLEIMETKLKISNELSDLKVAFRKLDNVFSSRVMLIQSNVRKWRARQLVGNMKCMKRLSTAQRGRLVRFLKVWREGFLARQRFIDSMYDDYDSYDDYYY